MYPNSNSNPNPNLDLSTPKPVTSMISYKVIHYTQFEHYGHLFLSSVDKQADGLKRPIHANKHRPNIVGVDNYVTGTS